MNDLESFTDGLCDALGVEYYSVIVLGEDPDNIRETSIDTGKFEITIRRSIEDE